MDVKRRVELSQLLEALPHTIENGADKHSLDAGNQQPLNACQRLHKRVVCEVGLSGLRGISFQGRNSLFRAGGNGVETHLCKPLSEAQRMIRYGLDGATQQHHDAGELLRRCSFSIQHRLQLFQLLLEALVFFGFATVHKGRTVRLHLFLFGPELRNLFRHLFNVVL